MKCIEHSAVYSQHVVISGPGMVQCKKRGHVVFSVQRRPSVPHFTFHILLSAFYRHPAPPTAQCLCVLE